jgi:hypothetical protein
MSNTSDINVRYRRCKTSISNEHKILKSSISNVTFYIKGPTLDIGRARGGRCGAAAAAGARAAAVLDVSAAQLVTVRPTATSRWAAGATRRGGIMARQSPPGPFRARLGPGRAHNTSAGRSPRRRPRAVDRKCEMSSCDAGEAANDLDSDWPGDRTARTGGPGPLAGTGIRVTVAGPLPQRPPDLARRPGERESIT